MTQASDEFLKALAALRRAADSEVTGAAHKAAAQLIDELTRLAGGGEYAGAGAEEVSFGAALADVRRLAERELSGNAFYLASNRLDALASLPLSHASEPAAPAPEVDAAPASAAPPEPETSQAQAPARVADATIESALQGASFDELAAASKARVDEVAASLGVELAHRHHDTPDLHRHVEETPHEETAPEKRSSEPCSMPEVVPLAVDAESAPAEAPVEVASVREVVEAAHEIGAPAIEAAPLPEAPAEIEVTPHPAAAPEPVAAPEPAPAAATEPPAPEPEHVPEPAPAAIATELPSPELEHVPEHAPAAVATQAPAPEQQAPKPEPAVAFDPAPEPARAPAREAAPAPAAKRDATARNEPKPNEPQKTFFSLWLDMVFGRRK